MAKGRKITRVSHKKFVVKIKGISIYYHERTAKTLPDKFVTYHNGNMEEAVLSFHHLYSAIHFLLKKPTAAQKKKFIELAKKFDPQSVDAIKKM